MPVIPEATSGGSFSHEDANQPFWVKSATYNAGTDTITVTVGKGRTDWGAGDITEFTSDQTLAITPVAINTTYYVFLDRQTDGLVANTTAAPSGTRIRLGSVATGASKSTLTRTDLRGMMPGAPSQVPEELFYMGGM